MPANPRPRPLPEREVPDIKPAYLKFLLEDEKITMQIANLWPNLERILLCIQRNPPAKEGRDRTAVCAAVDDIITVLQIFANMGQSDLKRLEALAVKPPSL